jgi:ArsR family transcriptional regulator
VDARTRKLYRLKAKVIAAAGQPIRLAIIDFLREGERCVCDIARHLDAGRPNVSRHLAVLSQAGIVRSRKDGLRVLYSLCCRCVLKFTDCVAGVLKEQAKEARSVLGQL